MEEKGLLNSDNQPIKEGDIIELPKKKHKLDWATWMLIIISATILIYIFVVGFHTLQVQVNGCDYCKNPITYYYGTLTTDDTTYKEFKHWESDDNIDGVSLYYMTTQGWFIDSSIDSDPFIQTQRISVYHCPICGRELSIIEGEERVN